ncbi:ATP-binding protein [Roseateles oligotrophus]|uniref:ATP-binding protein n=1 Tax=Roseateles oligotrophus TaxID=1769250 RepID=A0ABT2YMF9_9BURK|nr:ATP-binding protein [Roseateles oligotrophus]MCV2371257.1 ATP-binding protein [Roseateles oligotrophus]
MAGLLIAIVGAESSGKSVLAQDLTLRLAEATGLRCTLVPELLRGWCEAAGRTPRADEQQGIAAEQTARIDAAALLNDIVLCDTTALMTAVYSQFLFEDSSLLLAGQNFHRRCALTLLTALDLPWVADGLQRDGPQVRGPVDAAIRRALSSARLGWSVVAGAGSARVDAALNAITPLLKARPMPRAGLFSRLADRQDALPEWRWACENCDVPECEHQDLRRKAGLLPQA